MQSARRGRVAQAPKPQTVTTMATSRRTIPACRPGRQRVAWPYIHDGHQPGRPAEGRSWTNVEVFPDARAVSRRCASCYKRLVSEGYSSQVQNPPHRTRQYSAELGPVDFGRHLIEPVCRQFYEEVTGYPEYRRPGRRPLFPSTEVVFLLRLVQGRAQRRSASGSLPGRRHGDGRPGWRAARRARRSTEGSMPRLRPVAFLAAVGR